MWRKAEHTSTSENVPNPAIYGTRDDIHVRGPRPEYRKAVKPKYAFLRVKSGLNLPILQSTRFERKLLCNAKARAPVTDKAQAYLREGPSHTFCNVQHWKESSHASAEVRDQGRTQTRVCLHYQQIHASCDIQGSGRSSQAMPRPKSQWVPKSREGLYQKHNY